MSRDIGDEIKIYRRDSFSSSDENWKYYFRKSIVRRMIQERRLRVTHTVHTRKNNRLLKAKKGLTNSLPLRQLSILSLTQSIVFQVWASMLHIRLRPCTILLTWNFSKFIFSVFCLLKKIDFYAKFYWKIRWKPVYCLVDILLNNLCKFPSATFWF